MSAYPCNELSTTLTIEFMARIKKGQHWGGDWTEEKLAAFSKYVNAYLTIMNKYRDKYNWRLIYFDGFAGSGSSEHAPDTVLEDDNILLHELESANLYNPAQAELYKGAAERVLDINQRGFDIYYFVDKNQDSKLALEHRLAPYASTHNLQFRCNDANKMLSKMAEHLKTPKGTKDKSLVLLDPFGRQINWDSIANFNDTKGVDFWILVPTGVIVNRLLDKKGELRHIGRLKDFFGLEETEIRNYFYTKKHECTLFGEEDIIVKVNEPIAKIASLYLERLKTIFEFVIPKPLILYNTMNVPIYHFVFASNNSTAVKIAKDIIGK